MLYMEKSKMGGFDSRLMKTEKKVTVEIKIETCRNHPESSTE